MEEMQELERDVDGEIGPFEHIDDTPEVDQWWKGYE